MRFLTPSGKLRNTMYSSSNQECWKYLEVWGQRITEVPQWGSGAKPLYGALGNEVSQKLSIFAYRYLKFIHLVMNQTTFYTPWLIDY